MKAFINVHNILSLVQYCLFEPNKCNYLVLHINTINILAPFKQHWLVSGLSENRTSVSLKVQFRSTSVYLYADKKHRMFRNMMDVDDDHESVFMFQNEHWVDSPRGRWENYDCHWFGSGTNNTRFHLGITIINFGFIYRLNHKEDLFIAEAYWVLKATPEHHESRGARKFFCFRGLRNFVRG